MSNVKIQQSNELGHRENLIAMLVAQGYSTKEIAEQVNLTERQLKNIKASPLFQLAVQNIQLAMQTDIRVNQLKIQKTASKAIDFVDNLLGLNAGDDISILKLQAAQAQAILAKAGFGEHSTVDINQKTQSIQTMLTPEELDELRKRS